MAHKKIWISNDILNIDSTDLEGILSHSISKSIDQSLEENIGNKLDYIGDQLRDIKESLQKIAASAREVSDR